MNIPQHTPDDNERKNNATPLPKSTDLTVLSCNTCGINVFLSTSKEYLLCPYCNQPFNTATQSRTIADEFDQEIILPARERAGSLYNSPRGLSKNIITLIYIALLVAAALMQIQSVDEYIFQPLLITLYSVAIMIFVLSRFIIATRYQPPQESEHRPTLSVFVPCMNEERVIRQTIEQIFAAEYPDERLEVICVNDGSADNTLEEMLNTLTRHPNLIVIDFPQNKGLCHGWAVSTLLATGEIMVCVDSDTFIVPGSLDKLVQGFADPEVGGVSGHCDIENAQQNLLTRMQDVRYFFSYNIMKAAESVSGTVSCLPGCFSAYRRVCVLRILDEWLNSKVMGVSGNYADDRSLTNLILKDYKIIYDNRALATTIAPEGWSIYVRQQARWNRSYLREVFKASKWIWRKRPGAALAWYAMMLLPLIEPLVMLTALLIFPLVNYLQDGIFDGPWSYLLGLATITGAWSLDYYSCTGRKSWWTGFLYTLSYMFFFSWQVYWALLTLTTRKWGTRSAASETETKPEPNNKLDPALQTAQILPGWTEPVAQAKSKYRRNWCVTLITLCALLVILIPGIIYYGKMLHTPEPDRIWSLSDFWKETTEGTVAKLTTPTAMTLKNLAAAEKGGAGKYQTTYNRFKLGLGRIELPIVHRNTPADVSLFFARCDKYVADGGKKAALGLAQGYLTFLYLTQIDQTPLHNRKEVEAFDRVIAELGPSGWLSTCVQESRFILDPASGYFQLDLEPGDIPGGKWIDNGRGFWKYCSFLTTVSRQATIQGDPDKQNIPLDSPEYRPDLNVFCCSALLKAYYDAGTWKALTENSYYFPIHDKIGSFLARYTLNPENTRTLTIAVPNCATEAYTIKSSQILLQIFAWCFNRGRFTDTEIWERPEWTFYLTTYIKNNNQGKKAIEDEIKYVPYTPAEHDWAYPWGARYIYQIPVIAGALNQNAATNTALHYNPELNLQDMLDYLELLKPLYPEAALNAGRRRATELMQNKTFKYDSKEFFTVFYEITSAIIEATKA